jgi:hypothetical protein
MLTRVKAAANGEALTGCASVALRARVKHIFARALSR